jgi:hypothetical protein
MVRQSIMAGSMWWSKAAQFMVLASKDRRASRVPISLSRVRPPRPNFLPIDPNSKKIVPPPGAPQSGDQGFNTWPLEYIPDGSHHSIPECCVTFSQDTVYALELSTSLEIKQPGSNLDCSLTMPRMISSLLNL